MEIHVHHDIEYRTYSNYGATRCEWYSCTYNVYDSFDAPEQIRTTDDEKKVDK